MKEHLDDDVLSVLNNFKWANNQKLKRKVEMRPEEICGHYIKQIGG